jgi:hypothetical protein
MHKVSRQPSFLAALLTYALSGIFRAFNATEQPLAKEAISYWTSFARSSDPSVNRADQSPVWTAGPSTRLVIQEGNSTVTTASVLEAVPADYMARCAVSFVVKPLEYRLTLCKPCHQFWMTVANDETRI